MLTIRGQLIEYANKSINDVCINQYEDYISGQKHKWACERFLSDLKRIGTDDFPFIWDEEEAIKIVEWFTLLRHKKGILAGQPIHLTVWQKFFVCQIYGWKHKDTGLRRFTKSFIEVGRKNAKTQMEAGIALYEISVGSTKNDEIYEGNCAGVKRDQSRKVFEEAKNMLKGSPLAVKFKCGRNRIEHIKTGSYLIMLSKDDKKSGDGGNPAIFIIDEYHEHPTDEFYSIAAYGQNTKESLLMIITTAGVDLTYPCYTQEYKYCSAVLNPDVDVINDTYYIDILEIDKDDDENNIRNWWKANPIRMSYPEGVKKIREAYEVAKEIPEKMPMFLTKCLNKWVQARENGYMDMSKWKLCEVNEIPYELRNKEVYVGFDMSAKIDLTSVAFIIPIMDDGVPKYVCFSHSFIPNKEKLRERIKIDKVPYESWVERGYLTITDTPIVDQSQVWEYVLKTCKENNWAISTLCFDPANASKMMMDLADKGYECVEVFQSHKSLNESCSGFREQTYMGNIVYLYNPLFNYAMSNAVIKKRNGLIKIDKDATTKRVDPVVAAHCAFKLALYHEFKTDLSKYATEEYLQRLYGGGSKQNAS